MKTAEKLLQMCVNHMSERETYEEAITTGDLISEIQNYLSTSHPTTLPSDEEIEYAATFNASDNILWTEDEERIAIRAYTDGAKDMRSLCETKLAEMEREMKAQSLRITQLENALKDSQILLKNFKTYATDSSAPVYFGGVSLDDALDANWNLIKSITTTP